MANDLGEVSRYLALNLVGLRQKRNLTQSQLATLADIPRSTITYFESGSGNPSLANLARLSAALQVSIEELLTRPRASCKLIQAKDLPKQKRNAAMIYKLLPDSIPGMEIDRIEIEANGRMPGVPHVTGAKEYLTVVQGEFTVHVAGEKFRVKSGDVLAFPGDQPHAYHNSANSKSVGFSVVVLAPAGA